MNIKQQYPIRYTIDKITSVNEAHSLIIASHNNNLDFTGASRVTGFDINYSQPENTKIAIAFSTGDKINWEQMTHTSGDVGGKYNIAGAWFKLDDEGGAVLLDEQNITYDSLLEEGNTIEELLTLNDIKAFCGYKVRVAIALKAENAKNAVPAVSLKIKAKNEGTQTQLISLSPVYDLGQDAKIVNIRSDSSTNNGGTITLQGDINQQNNWQLISTLTGKTANNIQFRAVLNAPDIGTSEAELNSIVMTYADSAKRVNNLDGTSEIISKTYNSLTPMYSCRATLRHDRLKDTQIKVYAAFRAKAAQVIDEELGTGDGKAHTYQLKHPGRISPDSVQIFHDGIAASKEFTIDGQNGRISCISPTGSKITCNYKYGYDLETWQELKLITTRYLDTFYESEYQITSAAPGYSYAIKAKYIPKLGRIDSNILGTSNGQQTTYKLLYPVRNNNITIYADDNILAKNNYLLSDDSQYVTISAPSGKRIKAAYDYISESPAIYNFRAVFSD